MPRKLNSFASPSPSSTALDKAFAASWIILLLGLKHPQFAPAGSEVGLNAHGFHVCGHSGRFVGLALCRPCSQGTQFVPGTIILRIVLQGFLQPGRGIVPQCLD